MNARAAVIVALTFVLAFSVSARSLLPATNAIGLANVVVTNVYWGSDPMVQSTAHPGDVNDQISVVLTNVGDDVARSVNATLILGPPLIYNYFENGVPASGSEISKFAGDMSSESSYTVAYIVSIDPNATEGIYHYDLHLSYKSARELNQIDKDVTIDVPLWRGDLHIQGILTTPTKMYPDSKQVDVKVTLVNSGKGDAKNVQLRLALTPPFTASSSGSDSIYVGDIPAGGTSDANFIVDVAEDAQFGQYNIALGEQTGSSLIPIGVLPLYVGEKVIFDIVSVNPDTVHSGDSGDVVAVAIKNTGSVKAESVRVELRVGNFFTGTLTDFLGDMLAGETKTAFFTVDVDSKAQPGQYAIDLRFDWTQDTNSLDHTLSITLTVASPTVPVALIVVAVVVIAGAGGYFFMRRRRMKASQASQPAQK